MRFATRTFLGSFIPFAVLLAVSFWAIRASVMETVRDGLRASVRDNEVALAREQARSETPMASASPNAAGPDGIAPVTAPAAPPKPKKLPVNAAGQPLRGFFGSQSPQQQPQRPRAMQPRPPGSVGPSASVPGIFTR